MEMDFTIYLVILEKQLKMNNLFATHFANQLNSIQSQDGTLWNALAEVANVMQTKVQENISISFGLPDEYLEFEMLHQDFEISQLDIDPDYIPNFETPEYNPETVLFLRDSGIPIGILSFMNYRSNEKNVCNVSSFYICSSYVGKGYGTKMLNFLIDHCKTNDCNEIRLGVLEKNKSAKALYDHFGFKSYSSSMMLAL